MKPEPGNIPVGRGRSSLPPELWAEADAAAHREGAERAMQFVQQKAIALNELLSRPEGSMSEKDKLAQCIAITDELSDALLETPEPFRSWYLKKLTPLREQFRAASIKQS